MTTDTPHFTPELFQFLRDLKEHNDRDWFATNKNRYEEHVKQPALRFITACGDGLHRLSPHFRSDPRPVGGSLFRIHRDTRFSADKTPYKTHVGIHFRHTAGQDVHAPGFYLHLEPGNSMVGVGLWQPDSPTLKRIRDALVADPAGWQAAVRSEPFTARFTLDAEALARPPKGYDPNHPLVTDLKRKNHAAMAHLDDQTVCDPRFREEFLQLCQDGAPLVRFLCQAVDAAW